MSPISLRLTPHGHLIAEAREDASDLDDSLAERLGKAFAQGTGYGLLQLGAGEIGQALPPVLAWWRAFAARYVAALCLHAAGAGEEAPPANVPDVPAPGEADLASLALTAPMMTGAEYLTPEVLRS